MSPRELIAAWGTPEMRNDWPPPKCGVPCSFVFAAASGFTRGTGAGPKIRSAMRETLCRRARPRLGLLLLAALLPAVADAEPMHPAFVDAATVVPGLEVEMRYAGPLNFVGTKITGYEK